MSKPVIEPSAMGKAAKGLGNIIAIIIVLAVAILGDVMYIVEMQKVFPSGFLLAFCYLGAFTSFLAIGYLLLGKSVTFRPGGQMLAAWVVFGMELSIIGLNIILAFNPDRSGFLGVWAYISPATPVLHMLGVALIYFMDPDQKSKHEAMEMQEKMDKSERQVEYETFNARIALRRRQVEHVSKALEQAVNSPESLAYIQQFGYTLNRELLTELTGMSLAAPLPAPGLPAPGSSGQPAPRVVSSDLESDEWDQNSAWLQGVNDRMAAERERRRAEQTPEPDPDLSRKERFKQMLGAAFSGFTTKDEGNTIERGREAEMQRVVDLVLSLVADGRLSVEQLERAERFLGCFADGAAPVIDEARIRRVAYVGMQHGYTVEDLLKFVGGDDAKKK